MSIKNCFHCGKETTNLKFCSRSCSAKETNKIPKRKLKKQCASCENLIRNHRSSLCEHHYQESIKNRKEYLQNLTLNDYVNRKCIKKLHQSSKYVHIRGFCRSWNKDKSKLPCHACGYSKHVELAHIIPLNRFPLTATIGEVNASTNIIQLCPNCHWEFDNDLLDLVFPEQSKSQ